MRSPAVPALLLALCAACGADAPETAPDGALRVGFVATEGDRPEAGLRGARLGAAEAARAGELIGRPFQLITARAGSGEEVESAARDLVERGAFALVGGYDEPSCAALSRVAQAEGVLFLNVGCRAEEARRAPAPLTFHVEASQRMYGAALPMAVAGATDTAVVLWHAGLSRYGAAQLNDRFERQTRAFADPAGWAGWMAVKVLWESVARARSDDAAALAAFLASDSARFDGHKGESLHFDPATHQLRQPLYRIDPTAVPRRETREGGELPEAGAEVPLTGTRYAFVSNEGSSDVTVIDTETHRPVSHIRVGARPRGIAVSPDGRLVYVALSDDAPLAESDADAVAVIDLRQGKVVGRYRVGSDPEQFAVSPRGDRLYSANEDAGTASVTGLPDGEVIATLVVGIEPEGVAVSPDGRWVYVTAETSNTVSVVDTRTNEVAASFLVDVRPRGVAFSPTAPRAYVTNEISGTLSIVDTREHRVVRTLSLQDGQAKPVGVAVSPDGARVYVANGHGNSVSVIDAATDSVIAEVPVGRRPWGIAVSPDGSLVYTANGVSNDVSVVDTRSLRVVHTLPAGERPWGVAVTPNP